MPSKSTNKQQHKVLLLFLSLLLVLGGLFVVKAAKYTQNLYQYFFKKEIELKKTPEERINILLLGIGGGSHDGPLLTDTIMFASIDPENKRVTLISIPRDLWVPDLKAKINTAYAYGEVQKDGGGLVLTKAVVKKILGQEIDYGFRIDFNGFIRAVDMVGGLDVTVDRAFDDYEYPLSGKETDDCGFTDEEFEKRATAEAQLEAFPCRYEHLHFDQGEQHMDGETALKFVRSRHATGAEGTDFARSKRQEKIIRALREKVISAGTFLNPIKLVGLYDVLKDSIDTDIKQEEYDDFVKLGQKMEKAAIHSVVLDSGDEELQTAGLLVNPPVSEEFKYQWVIVPRLGSDTYTEIHEYVACLIEKGNACTITPLPEENQ